MMTFVETFALRLLILHFSLKYGFYRENFIIFRTIFDLKTLSESRRDIEVDLRLVFLYYSAIILLFQANVIMYVVVLRSKSCQP